MDSVVDHLNKVREERIAREKARIEKLRELNLKKYNKNDLPSTKSQIPANNTASKIVMTSRVSQITKVPLKHVCHASTSRRPSTAPLLMKRSDKNAKDTKNASHTESKIIHNGQKKLFDNDLSKNARNTDIKGSITNVHQISTDKKPVTTNSEKTASNNNKDKPISIVKTEKVTKADIKPQNDKQANAVKSDKKSIENRVLQEINIFKKQNHAIRKSMAPTTTFSKPAAKASRKSMLPKLLENPKTESVFERLYKPKITDKKPLEKAENFRTNPNYLKKAIENSRLVFNKRQTVCEGNGSKKMPVRRSISAVHFRRVGKDEIGNCIHKWSSIGDKLNKSGLNRNEDEEVREDKIVSTVKSERKTVSFLTPKLGTPCPGELQARLKSWLEKRGKSLSSYQHLQCFGINHFKSDMTPKYDPSNENNTPTQLIDEENKENIACDTDSDNESFNDNVNEEIEILAGGDTIDIYNWRNASFGSLSVGFDDSVNPLNESTVTSVETLSTVDELLVGALNDLTTLLREGFDWQQSVRWLRSIKERFPNAPSTSAYWECRAALEDSRGDLPASIECWKEAIAKGTEHSVVESNLDQLLVKFMQLKISPKSGKRHYDSKLLDAKNIFKSNLIRFAVQQAKRQSDASVFTVTPVRRSARLSHCPTGRTPVRLCDSMRQVAAVAPDHVFTPNANLAPTP